MTEKFINTATTIAWDDMDFCDWHSGIECYGFWALIIEDKQWLREVSAATRYMSPYLLPGYQRQPHVSIIAGGLMSEQYYSSTIINKQKQVLLNTTISPFSIRLAGINSFASVPYLTIVDNDRGLAQLRSELLAVAGEDDLDSYQAHITLGLYRGEFSTLALNETINGFNASKVELLEVSAVKFCSYQTNDIQGRITVLDSIKLNTKSHRRDRK